MNAHENPVAAHALAYAQRGLHVFPAPPGQKKSFKAAKNSPADASGVRRPIQMRLRKISGNGPNANVGIVTGPKSGIFVVECDTPEGHDVDGIAALRQLEATYGHAPRNANGRKSVRARCTIISSIRAT